MSEIDKEKANIDASIKNIEKQIEASELLLKWFIELNGMSHITGDQRQEFARDFTILRENMRSVLKKLEENKELIEKSKEYRDVINQLKFILDSVKWED